MTESTLMTRTAFAIIAMFSINCDSSMAQKIHYLYFNYNLLLHDLECRNTCFLHWIPSWPGLQGTVSLWPCNPAPSNTLTSKIIELVLNFPSLKTNINAALLNFSNQPVYNILKLSFIYKFLFFCTDTWKSRTLCRISTTNSTDCCYHGQR